MGGKVRILKTLTYKNRRPGLRLHRFNPAPYRYFALGSAVFVFTFLAASVFMPVKTSGAEEVTVTNRATGYYVTVSSGDNVNLDVDSTPTGALAAAKDTVNVKTNAPSGYQLYLSASTDGLYNTTDIAHEKVHFTSVSGTLDDPVELGQNTWGFSLDEQDTADPSNSATWATVTTAGSLISENDAATSSAGDDLDVYYGVNATTRLPAGTYSTVVTYTALAEGVSETLMQDFTMTECAALNTGSVVRLMDSRNTNIYNVVKAADGNCWMADNLDLYDITIYPEDSDLDSGSFYIPASSTWTTNVTSEAKVHVATNSGYEGEVYYNWYAATAGSTLTSGTAPDSICPKGWQLPVNGDSSTDKSWANLLDAYSITTGAQLLANSDLGFTKYYGYWRWYDNSEWEQGSLGYFWSSIPYGADRAYNVSYDSTAIHLQGTNNKGVGFPVRCVFSGQSTDYLQNFTIELCEAMTELSSKTLIDSRDGKTYSVVKAKDGNCWMADNLKYAITSSSSWSTNNYTDQLLHIATSSGYEGEYYYNYPAALESCPTGWSLPVSGDETVDHSWAKLLAAHEITTGAELLADSNLGFDYFGDWDWSLNSEANQGTYGFFWTSTPAASDVANTFYYYSASVDAQHSNHRGFGFPVRCVFEDRTLEDLTYLQDTNSQVCANTETSTTASVYDKRGRGSAGSGSDPYGVVKAKDGNCWMTDNLDLYNYTATVANTDFDYASSLIPSSSTWNTNVNNAAKVHAATNSGYTDQVYYNWCAAVALASPCTTTDQVDQSICPKNWRLPVNGDSSTDKSWAKLLGAYDITTGHALRTDATELGFSSYYGYWDWNANKEGTQGSGAMFWTSTPAAADTTYALLFPASANLDAQKIYGKGYGFSLRCLAR